MDAEYREIGGVLLPDYKFDKIDEILLNLICRGVCEFYKEGIHEKNWEKYQCGAYLGLKKMLKEGKITKEKLEKLLKNMKVKEKNI